MAKNSPEKLTKEFVEHIIKELGLKASVTTNLNQELVAVTIEGDNLGALIGYHGETLESLQLILSLMLNRSLKEQDWRRVVVDVGGWREERKETLKNMVEKAASEISQSGEGRVSLPPMSASQRRDVHVIVSESFPEYSTVSEGEEPYRKVFLVKNS